MAAGCCGTKKQKLNNSSSVPCNGSVLQNGTQLRNSVIVKPEMGFFCFDVLYCQLHQLDPPKPPNFSNEALWVILFLDIIFNFFHFLFFLSYCYLFLFYSYLYHTCLSSAALSFLFKCYVRVCTFTFLQFLCYNVIHPTTGYNVN